MKIFKIVVFFSFFFSSSLFSCPTCVGRIKAESPPFFSDEFYQPNQPISRQTKEEIGHAQLKKLISSKRSKQ